MSVMQRGSCPSLARPMLTGDGLLARLTPATPLPIDAFIGLCKAAERHGNGIIEITQRGSWQIRGLSERSTIDFSRAVSNLQSSLDTPPAVLTSPLLGLDAQESFDSSVLVSMIRSQLHTRSYSASLAPKVSVLIDSGGTMPLDHISADIRLHAISNEGCHLALGGDAARACHVGVVQLPDVIAVLDVVLAWLASQGARARMRDTLSASHLNALRALLSGRLTLSPPPSLRAPAESIGSHRLKDGTIARGFGLVFGHAAAQTLEQFARFAADCNVTAVAAACDRVLLMIGLTANAAERLDSAALEAGLVTEPHDARRHVVTCVGAPGCSAATWSTREIATAVAAAAKPMLDGSITLHLSGCRKGCAHPNRAAMTLVGPDGLVLEGCAGDTPHATFSPEQLTSALRRSCLALLRERRMNERTHDVLARLGTARVIEWFAPEDSQ